MVAVLFLCTGNATRSVLAGAVLSGLRPDVSVATAGTLVLPGLPMSWRTRAGFEAIGVPVPDHRSTQADESHLVAADLIIGFAPEHVAWVRREHPDHAARSATLPRLVRDLAAPVGAGFERRGLSERIGALGLGRVELEEWEDVADPGGGELEEFIACSHQVKDLVTSLAPNL